MAELTVEILEHRLRLAHTARESRETLLDDVRTALVDIGWLQDGDPYGHGDLADVIRQVGGDRPGLATTGGSCAAVSDRIGLNRDRVYGCILADGHKGTWHEDQGGAKWRQIEQPAPEQPTALAPCSINHDCPSQPRLVATTARGEARCQSQHRPDGEPLVQCALAVHAGDSHTDYDGYGQPLAGRNPELPWLTWRDKSEEADRGDGFRGGGLGVV